MATPSRRDAFLALSTALTGCATDVLDSADSAAGYLAIADAKAGAVNIDALLRIYAEQTANGARTPQQAIAAILGGGLDASWSAWSLSKGTRSLLKLWFTGRWIDDSNPDGGQPYPSAQAYARGLVWLAAQAHAVGVSTSRFGYWKDAPPPLSEFVGDAP